MTLPPGIVGTGSYDEPVTRERLLAWRLANQYLAATRTGDPAQRAADLAEAVRAAPGAVNQDKDRHRFGPIPRRVLPA